MSLLTLLEAANFLDSTAESTAAVPRDASGSEKSPSSTIIFPLAVPDKDAGSPLNVSSQCNNPDILAVRRSGGAGTREVHNKLEKYRRAQLKECFANLRQFINIPENRKMSNLAILRSAIRHIKSLNESYTRLTKILSKEKFEQVALKNFLHHNVSLDNPLVLENLLLPSISSPSTDTASDDNDEDDADVPNVIESANPSVLVSSDPVPTQCPDVTSTASSSNIILFCPALPQKVTPLQGTVISPPALSANSVVLPLKHTASATSKMAPVQPVLPGLLPATHLTFSPVDSLVTLPSDISMISGPPVSKETIRTNSVLKNSSARLMVPRTSSEATSASSHLGNSRPVVQMLQQTITQRAILQQEKQRQMLDQSQQTQETLPSQKGLPTNAAKKVTQLLPATLVLATSIGQTTSSSLSSSLLFSSPTPTFSTTKTPFPQTSTALMLAARSLPSGSTLMQKSLPGIAAMPVAATSTQHAAPLPGTSLTGTGLMGTSLAGAGLVTSGMFLQLMSQGQLGALQMGSLDDIPQPGGGQLVAIYPMVSSIPLAQFLTPVTIEPSNIPTSGAMSSYRSQEIVALLQTASNQAKLIEQEDVAP